jgi:hypothetical protein
MAVDTNKLDHGLSLDGSKEPLRTRSSAGARGWGGEWGCQHVHRSTKVWWVVGGVSTCTYPGDKRPCNGLDGSEEHYENKQGHHS